MTCGSELLKWGDRRDEGWMTMEIEEFFGDQFHQWGEHFRYYEMAITELESDLGII